MTSISETEVEEEEVEGGKGVINETDGNGDKDCVGDNNGDDALKRDEQGRGEEDAEEKE